MFKTLFIVCLSFYVALAKHEQYDGHALYQVSVSSIEHAQFLNELQNQIAIDIFSYAVPGRDGEVLVPKELKEEFENQMSVAGIEHNIIVENIREQLLLEDELLAAAAAKKSDRSGPGLSFDTIHSYEVVDQYMVDLAAQYPNTVSVVSGGRSVEGRDIKYLKISSTNFLDTNKPVVFIQSLLHAREWVTLPAILYAIEKLVIDVQELDLIRDIDWIILPIANPDGYVHSHVSARFWRKNRARGFVIGDVCVGVDLNRNFGHLWGQPGSSNNVCAETFRGLSAFSEPESQVVRSIFSQYGDRMESFMDIHSHGSMILFGFGDGNLPPNALILNLGAVNMAQAIDRVKLPGKRDYIVGNIRMVLYQASGGCSDYAQAIGVPLSYTYELPGPIGSGGLNGFLVQPDFIWQAGFETWEGIKTGARFSRDFFRRRRGL